MTSQERIAALRSVHKIQPVDVEHPDFGTIHRCSVCGIRVHWITRSWRHDNAEMVALLDEEYGQADSWGRERAIERILESMPDRDEDDPEDDWSNREGAPEFNGSFR